jgi:hypothetical protein
VPACSPCNRSKRDRPLAEWWQSIGHQRFTAGTLAAF